MVTGLVPRPPEDGNKSHSHASTTPCCLSYEKYQVTKEGWWLLASYPGPAQILFCSRGEKSGEGLGSKLCHGPEMVDSVSTNVLTESTIPGLLPIFLHSYKIKSGWGLGTRLDGCHIMI